MREFISWRRDYYSKLEKLPKNAKRHRTDNTLLWDMMLGKAIAKGSHEQGLRGMQALPTLPSLPAVDGNYADFSCMGIAEARRRKIRPNFL
jgi:hypothetical protein